MQSHATWSIGLGRWGGVRVRLHMFFLLFAAGTLYLGYRAEEEGGAGVMWVAVSSLGILLFSVALHELGHFLTARRLGGGCSEIVLGPLGGLASMQAPREASAEFLMHLAGPLVNLLLCVVAGVVLFVVDRNCLAGLVHPLAPQGLGDPTLIGGLRLTFWINWSLFLVNLLPAFPFDGGRALRAAIVSMRPGESPRRAAVIVATLAKVAAVGLLVVAWIVRGHETSLLVPLWLTLVLLAIFLFFSAKQEEERSFEADVDDELFGYDFSQGYTSLERSVPYSDEQFGPITRWLDRRRRVRLQRRREIEADEERRVDDILARLHQSGMESLSSEDRSLLKRVSARYRQRDREER